MAMPGIDYLLIGIASFFIATLAGLSGYGTGLMMPLVLIPLIGPQPVVPVLAVAAVFNNASGLAAFRDRIDWRRAFEMILVAVPFCLIGATFYTTLSGREAMLVIGAVLIAIVPARHLLLRRSLGLSRKGTLIAGAVYGLLVGGTPGAGVILIAVLLGSGMTGREVIATDSLVSLVVGFAKVATFQTLGFLPWEWWLYALVIGICGIPGAFIARWLVDRMSLRTQGVVIDIGVVIGGSVLILRGIGVM
jgi:uncharacterized protein